MNAGKIPIVDTAPPTDEQVRLKALFDELRKNQLTFLNEAGKRVIELSTGLLGVLFAVSAFGKDFPPPYLRDQSMAWFAVATLIFFFLALLAGFITVQPHEYKDYPHNLTMMADELRKITARKVFWFQAGSVLFVLGTGCLVILIIQILV